MNKDKITLANPLALFIYLTIVWGFYRYAFVLPEAVEELFLKPVLWLGPVFFLVFVKEKQRLQSIGVTWENFMPSIYFAITLGLIFAIEAMAINYFKYGGFEFNANIGSAPFLAAMGITVATSITEELTFRGYIFTRLLAALKNEWVANMLTTICWVLIHVPIVLFVWQYDAYSATTFLFLTALFGFGSAFIFGRTRNILAPILLHILWQWPIILFR